MPDILHRDDNHHRFRNQPIPKFALFSLKNTKKKKNFIIFEGTFPKYSIHIKEAEKNSINSKTSDIYEDPRYLSLKDLRKTTDQPKGKSEDEEISQLNPIDTIGVRKSNIFTHFFI